MGRRRNSAKRILGGVREAAARSSLGRGLRRWRARRRWSGGVSPSRSTDLGGLGGASLALPSPGSRRLAVARNLAIVYVVAALAVGALYSYQRGLVVPALSSMRDSATSASRALLDAVDMDTNTSRMVIGSVIPRGQEAVGGETAFPTEGAIRVWLISNLGLSMSDPRTLLESQLADPPAPVPEERALRVVPPKRAVGAEPRPGSAPEAAPVAAQAATSPSPSVVIYHTHTSETYKDEGCSYLWEKYKPDLTSEYLWGQRPGVVTVGTELTSALEGLGLHAYHSKKVHDYPEFKDAYKNALPTVEAMLSAHRDAGAVIDLHRDGLLKEVSASTTLVAGQQAATVFIVVTTDKFGLPHPNWKRNYAFALRLEKEINTLYPGLCRGVDLRNDARWNQQVSDHALILEVGSNLNVTKEALLTARLLAQPILAAISATGASD